MGLPVTVYRWDDVGAPSIGTSKPSEIINILKKCLVTGYGTKTSLGWTTVAESTSAKRIVFKNNVAGGGSGGCINIKSHDASDADGNTLWFQPCRTATSVTAMTNKGYIHSMQPEYWMNYDMWMVIGTAVGFFLVLGKSVNTNGYAAWTNSDERVVYCGDFKSSVSGDVSRFITYADFYQDKNETSGVTAAGWPVMLASARMSQQSPSIFRIYDTDGASSKFAPYQVSCNFPALASEALISTEPACDERTGEWWITYFGFQLGAPNVAEYKDRFGTPRTVSGFSPYMRGRLLGLLELDCARYADQPWPLYKTFNGHNHYAIRSATGGVSTFINLVEWL